MKKRILIIDNSIGFSGAEKSMYELLLGLSKEKYSLFVLRSLSNSFEVPSLKAIFLKLPFVWFVRKNNPFYFFKCLFSLLYCSFRIIRICKHYKINIVYANTFKSSLYTFLLKRITGLTVLCHVRDNSIPLLNNLKRNINCHYVSISKHIQLQLPLSVKNNYLVYGGIDTDYWKNNEMANNQGIKKRNPYTNSITIANIGQLTGWKNQKDFIKLAKIISEDYHNVNFLVVGDDLMGREKKYKNELLNLTEDLDMKNKIHFLGQKDDVKNIMRQIDILVHLAINEPFGRVIIEAMAMEKPVVAYNCGGPKEIIVDGQTGFLLDPNNYFQLAERAVELLENEELRQQMGKAGRQRVIEKFNIERYVRQMEEIFDDI